MLDRHSYDDSAFVISPQGSMNGKAVFKVELSPHNPLTACLFRGQLVEALFQYARDEWYLGNTKAGYIEFPNPADICLALSPSDADRLRSYGWING